MNSFFNDYGQIQVLSWDILDNIPSTYTGIMPPNVTLPFNQSLPVFVEKPPEGGADWALSFFNFIGENILKNFLGVGTESIVSFFTTSPHIPRDVLTARNLAKDMFMCDFESLMLCSRHNRRIFVSLVIAYWFYWICSTMLIRVGLTGIAGALIYAIPFVTLWLAYGLSPLCVPMIPTCIMTDVVESVQIVLPAKITWPDTLQVYPGCLGPKWYDANATIVVPQQFENITRGAAECMRSCKQQPFYFKSWEGTLAWVACSLDATSCKDLDIPYFPDFRRQTELYSGVILATTNATNFLPRDVYAAYSFCFWMTIAQAIPYLLLVLGILYLAVTMVQLPFMVAAAGMNCFVQAIIYTHVGEST
jgi:hypothetical protein